MKEQLHQSQINMFFRCPEQFRRRYLEGEIIPPGISLSVGSAVHTAAQINLTHKLENDGQLMGVSEVMDAARDDVKTRLKDAELNDDEKKEGKQKVTSNAIDTAVSLSGLHASKVAPILNPFKAPEGDQHGIEWPWVIETGDKHVYNLAGRIDVIEEKGKALNVRDLKTAAKSPAKDLVEKSLQLTIYALAAKIHFDKKSTVYIDSLVKTKEPKYVVQSAERTQNDFDAFMYRFESVEKGIEAGIFTPAQPESWWCSKKFCGYHSTCKYVQGYKVFGV